MKTAPLLLGGVLLVSVSHLYAINEGRGDPGDRPPSAQAVRAALKERRAAEARAEGYRKEAKAARAAKSELEKGIQFGKDLLDKVDQKIAEYENKIAELEKKGDLSQAVADSKDNANRVGKEDAEFAAGAVKEELENIGKTINPAAEAIGKGKQAKEYLEHALDTVSWDMPVIEAEKRQDEIAALREKLEKLQNSRPAVVGYQKYQANLVKAAAARIAAKEKAASAVSPRSANSSFSSSSSREGPGNQGRKDPKGPGKDPGPSRDPDPDPGGNGWPGGVPP